MTKFSGATQRPHHYSASVDFVTAGWTQDGDR